MFVLKSRIVQVRFQYPSGEVMRPKINVLSLSTLLNSPHPTTHYFGFFLSGANSMRIPELEYKQTIVEWPVLNTRVTRADDCRTQ